MKKIRLLALLLVILMVSSAFIFASCDNTDEDTCADGEHEWKNEQNPQKRKEIQARSCTNPEIRERECKVCGHTEAYEAEPPTGHRYNSTLKVYLQDATCTEDGHTVTHCQFYKICGSAADRIEVLPGSALDHEYVNYVRTEDGYTSIAKCIRCDSTSEKLLGLKLDMEGDRSHLSYQAMTIYTSNAEGAAKYETVVEGEINNTYLSITRPDDFEGDMSFGISLKPEVENLVGKTYVIEADFIIDKDETDDFVLFKAVKAQFNQSMTFLTYDSATKTIKSLNGAVYTLLEDDFGARLKVSLLVNDTDQTYQVYIDDKLASDRPVHYVGDYYAGIPLKSIETTMLGDGASTFGIDNIYFYPAEEPSGYDGEAVYYYTTHQILSEHTITFKTPLLSDTHTVHNFVQVEVFEPECAISGYTLTTCDGCGGQMISDEVPATGHNYDNGVNVPANCVDAGFFVKTCYGCGQKTGEPTEPATGHIHGDDAKVVAPTCQADGYTEGNCKYCGFFFTVTDEGTKTGHQLGDDAVMVKATCSVNGGLTGKCKYCGTDYIDPDTFVEAYGHYDFTFSEYTTVEPTCTEGGYEEHKCLSCGETYKDNEVEAKGHRSYDVIDGNIITTKCVDCDYTNSLHVYTEGDIPDYAEMESVVKKDNMILSYYANESTWGTSGSLTAANAPRYAKWTDVNENGNSFARIEIASFESIKSLLTPDGNAHAHRDYMASSKSKPGATLVFEFDVKHPEELEDHQTNGFISVSGYADSGSNTFSILTVNKNGTIVCNSKTIGTISNTEWTKIAMVLDCETGAGIVYVDGASKGSFDFTGHINKGLKYVTQLRLDLGNASQDSTTKVWSAGTRDATKNMVIELDNMYAYYADRPVYITSVGGPTDMKDCDPATVNAFYTGEFSDYIKTLCGADIGYKLNSKLSLVDLNTDGVKDAIHYEVKPEIKSKGTKAGEYDTHFTPSFTKGQKLTFHTNITFNKVTGVLDIFDGRRTEGGANGASNVQYGFVDYSYKGIDGEGRPYGVIKVAEQSDVVWTVYEGETLDIYVTNDDAAMTCDIYINGKLVLDNFDYSTQLPNYSKPYKGLTYKIFNNNGGDPSASTDKIIDIYINEIDFFSGAVAPSNYEGKNIADKTVEGESLTIVEFDGTEDANLFLGANSSKVNDGYYYSEINHSYLSLTKNPATTVRTGNLRYVMIDHEGNEVTEGGVWTVAANDFKANGVPSIVFDDFKGVPINPETGNYDFEGYSQLKIRFYVKSNTASLKFMTKVNMPDYVDPNRDDNNNGIPDETYKVNGTDFKENGGGIAYFSSPETAYTEGWHEITYTISSTANASRGQLGWENVQSIDFTFTGWNNNANTANGLSIYVANIVLVKADETLADTGYYMAGSPCASHTWGEPVVGREATCDQAGYTYKTCTVCGYKDTTVVPSEGHNLELVTAECVAATCDTRGKNIYKCTNEGCTFKTKEVTSILLHNYVRKDNATPEEGYVPATCTEGGTDIYICANENCPGYKCTDKANCNGKVYTTFRIPSQPLGHTHDDTATVNEAKCGVDKTTVGECITCHETVTITYADTALEHDMVTDEEAATCTTDGHKTVKCQRDGCDYIESHEVYPKHGHSRPADYLVTFVERTCATFKGVKYTCLTCGTFVEDNEEELGKVPHVWGSWTVERPATCGEDGYQEAYCQVCNHKMSEEGTIEERQLSIIPATGNHTYGEEYVYTNEDDKSLEGIKYIPCTTCGQAKPGTEVKVPAEYTGTPGLVFTDNKNGAFVITGYTGDATEIVIPATYSGKPVIIGNAFVGNAKITSVTIPAGVKIADGAFKNCVALETVNLPSDLTALPAEIFYGCVALESITLPESCTVIGTGAFYGCIKLETVEIKATLTKIEQFAFDGCTALKTVKYVVASRPEDVIAENGNDKLFDAQWIA